MSEHTVRNLAVPTTTPGAVLTVIHRDDAWRLVDRAFEAKAESWLRPHKEAVNEKEGATYLAMHACPDQIARQRNVGEKELKRVETPIKWMEREN